MTHCPLLVFADDWGRHPSSCQHLVRRLLRDRPVHWVNTIGTRAPRLDRASLRRAGEKLRQWLRPARPAPADDAPAGLRVHNPRMWPWFGSAFARGLNRRLLLRQLGPVVASLPEAPVAVTTLPIVADLMGRLPVRRWVYYCVDDFGQWPGLDQEPLRRMEEQVVAKADVLVAVSETLQARLARMGRASLLLTHGVDFDFWSEPPPGPPLAALEGLERPLVVFWGVVDRRMDTAFVRRLGADLQRGTVVLLGPEADPDPALVGTPRVVRVAPLPFEQLPRLARVAGVLVMPYADLPVTRAIQPLKLKEYLATGKPVVVRDLPAARDWADCLDLCGSAESFSAAVRARLQGGTPEAQRRARGRLPQESWDEKARRFAHWALGRESPSHAVACP
jgi:glycosyltransferase involved in cell wall biosynthesis